MIAPKPQVIASMKERLKRVMSLRFISPHTGDEPEFFFRCSNANCLTNLYDCCFRYGCAVKKGASGTVIHQNDIVTTELKGTVLRGYTGSLIINANADIICSPLSNGERFRREGICSIPV
jgi:hypothetical protein